MATVLVLNPGSSSLKASLVELPRKTVGRVELAWRAGRTPAEDRGATIEAALRELDVGGQAFDAVGYRVVHGGVRFSAPTLIDDDVVAAIRRQRDLAPLHTDVAVETIGAGRTGWPERPHVACFDTAFHASLPPEAMRYAVPERWFVDWGIRRFGFHGLSVAWSAGRAAGLLGRDPLGLRLVVAHLGSGCSVTAVDGERSVHTSMGMTPLEGLMMSTRSGSVDPGVLLRLIEDGRRTAGELSDDLDLASGLLGVSGVSGDLREVEAASRAGDARAALAVAMFVRRAASAIGAAATALPTLDALVFSGGIGEHAASIRAAIVSRLAVLGMSPISPEDDANHDRILNDQGPAAAVIVIEAREDLVIAGETGRLLGL